jgi:hypothetical protein
MIHRRAQSGRFLIPDKVSAKEKVAAYVRKSVSGRMGGLVVRGDGLRLL